MNLNEERKRLSRVLNLEDMRRELRPTDMVTVFQIERDSLHHERLIYSALIPDNQIEEALSDSKWDLNIGYGLPCEVSGDETKYLRYGVRNGVEPLVIHVGGYHPLEPWVEISEEFRLFHYLYHRDGKTDKYFRIDESNEEVVVATVKPDHVQIRLKEIFQWLLLKDMSLSIQFRCWEHSEHSLEELGFAPTELEGIQNETWKNLHRDELTCWRHSYADLRGAGIGDYQTDSKLEGKRIIKPVPISHERRYVEFIVNAHGDEYTCDPNKLGEYPGEKSDLAWKLTRVHFSKQVLDKYYNEPSKYEVSDSLVSCGLWGSIKIDNHHPDKVCVFLDHLGIHLPYSEQLHWRAHNILPEGGVSKTFYERMVEGEWANTDQPDLLFKQSYEQLQKACDEVLGWQLLKSLGSGDEYRFQRLRVPVNDEQCHFDDLVQDLQTILIESIDVKRLKQLLPEAERANLTGKRSIEVLGEILDFHSVEGADHRVAFLQKLQTLRSKGSSHLKGSGYQKIANYFGVDSLGQQEAFIGILKHALDTVDFFTYIVRNGKLDCKNGEDC